MDKLPTRCLSLNLGIPVDLPNLRWPLKTRWLTSRCSCAGSLKAANPSNVGIFFFEWVLTAVCAVSLLRSGVGGRLSDGVLSNHSTLDQAIWAEIYMCPWEQIIWICLSQLVGERSNLHLCFPLASSWLLYCFSILARPPLKLLLALPCTIRIARLGVSVCNRSMLCQQGIGPLGV